MLIWLEKITNNNSLLNIISSGNRNQFPIALYQSKPIVSVTSKLNSEIIEGQILNHLESDAISIFPSAEGHHISTEYLLLKNQMVKSSYHRGASLSSAYNEGVSLNDIFESWRLD